MIDHDIEQEILDARKALKCLYLEVYEAIARDVEYHVNVAIIGLRTALILRDRALRGMLEVLQDVENELVIAALHGMTGTPARRAANQARIDAAKTALGNPSLTPHKWIIHFEDADRGVEFFAGEGADEGAKKRFAIALQQWNCQLFVMVDDGKRVGIGPELPPIESQS